MPPPPAQHDLSAICHAAERPTLTPRCCCRYQVSPGHDDPHTRDALVERARHQHALRCATRRRRSALLTFDFNVDASGGHYYYERGELA